MLHRLSVQIEHVLRVNEMTHITDEVVDAARSTLVIGATWTVPNSDEDSVPLIAESHSRYAAKTSQETRPFQPGPSMGQFQRAKAAN